MSDSMHQKEQRGGHPSDRGMGLLDLVATLVKHRWLIIGIACGITVLTLAFLLVTSRMPTDSRWNLLPDKYAPSARVLLLESNASSSLSQALSNSGLGDLANLAGLGGATKKTNIDLVRDLLKSRDLLDEVASEFGFVERYGITTDPRTRTRLAITRRLTFDYNSQSGVLEIAYVDTDREFATRIVARIVELLEAEFKRLTLDKVAVKRAYLESSVASQIQKTDEAATAYIAFQRTYGVLDVTTEASDLSRSVASIRAQITSKELELRVAEQYYPATDARIVKLKAEIEQLQALQRSMREGSSEFGDPELAQQDLPRLSVQYLALKREMEIQQSILGLLKQQLEVTRLEELDTSGIFQVIDRAELPEQKALPHRSKIAVIAAFAGVLVGVLSAFLASYFERAARDPQQAENMQTIRSALGPRRRGKPRPR